MSGKTLTVQQIRIRDYILKYQEQHHTRPVYKEIRQALRLSLSTISQQVQKLESLGFGLMYVQVTECQECHMPLVKYGDRPVHAVGAKIECP
jgi:DNA-binding MarR family transcriptional regulator